VVDKNLRIHTGTMASAHALADFNNTANSTGWAFLRITTNPNDPDVE